METLTPEQRANVMPRFEAKFSPEPNSGCWLWTASGSPYGKVAVDGVTRAAHRISWLLYRGGIPKGMHVCHTCDVQACVNPAHLWLGTAADNHADKATKGRGRGPKLTDADLAFVADVLPRRKRGETLEEIARSRGVSRQAVDQRLKFVLAKMAAVKSGRKLRTYRSLVATHDLHATPITTA